MTESVKNGIFCIKVSEHIPQLTLNYVVTAYTLQARIWNGGCTVLSFYDEAGLTA